ncbi:MAG: LapA family protein [Pseudomonadota bacterium]
MRYVKIALWALAGIVLTVVFLQNRWFFLDERAFRVNLYAFKGSSPELPLFLYMALSFALGFVVAWLAGLPARLGLRRELKAATGRVRELEAAAPAPKTREPGRPVLDLSESAPDPEPKT